MKEEGRAWILPALGLFLAALLLRLLHASGSPLPSIDGSHYLAQARDLAQGRWSEALRCVFPPGAGLLSAPLCALGLEPHAAARLMGSLAGALFVAVLWAAGRRAGGMPFPLALLAACSFPGVRLVGEGASEPFFQLLTAWGILDCLWARPARAGLLFGLAFWIRPEALAFLPLLFLGRVPRARRGLFCALAAAASYPLLRFLLLGEGPGIPKAAFMAPMGPLGEEDFPAFLRALWGNALALPSKAFPGTDWVVLPLALLGLPLLWRKGRRDALCFLAVLLVAWGAMLLFQVKARFFQSQVPLLFLLAGRAVSSFGGRGGRALSCLVLLALLAALLRLGTDLLDPPRSDKRAEIALGRSLADRIPDLRALVTDMPRVLWAAGHHPPPPLEWTPLLLEEALKGPEVAFVVLGIRRRGRRELMERQGDRFEALPLPAGVRGLPGADRMGLYRRRRKD